jgi:hypothetical protein
MPRPSTYEVVLASKAAAFLLSLPRSKQRKLLQLVQELAKNPGQIGDYPVFDATGRRIENILLNEWHISFWADHAAKEFRIVELAEL